MKISVKEVDNLFIFPVHGPPSLCSSMMYYVLMVTFIVYESIDTRSTLTQFSNIGILSFYIKYTEARQHVWPITQRLILIDHFILGVLSNN